MIINAAIFTSVQGLSDPLEVPRFQSTREALPLGIAAEYCHESVLVGDGKLIAGWEPRDAIIRARIRHDFVHYKFSIMRVSAEEELEQCARETRINEDTYAARETSYSLSQL